MRFVHTARAHCAHAHAVKLERGIDCLRLTLDKQSLGTSPLSQTFWCIVTRYA